MARNDLLRQAIDNATDPVFPTTREEVIRAYQEQFGNDWRKHIANDIAQVSGIKPESALRRFRKRGSSVTKPSKKSQQEFAQIGRKMPAIGRRPKGDTITVTVAGRQKGRGARRITATFAGSDAQKFVDNPSYLDIWEQYGFTDEDAESFEDGDYMLDVITVFAS